MKYLISLGLLLAPFAFAEEKCSEDQKVTQAQELKEVKTSAPKFLEGGTITIKQVDGRTETVSADEYMVIKRLHKRPVIKVSSVTVRSCSNLNRNRVSLLAGQGPKGGLDSERSYAPDEVTVESKVGLVGGAQYQRLLPVLSDRLSIGVQGQSNGTALGTIGLDF